MTIWKTLGLLALGDVQCFGASLFGASETFENTCHSQATCNVIILAIGAAIYIDYYNYKLKSWPCFVTGTNMNASQKQKISGSAWRNCHPSLGVFPIGVTRAMKVEWHFNSLSLCGDILFIRSG